MSAQRPASTRAPGTARVAATRACAFPMARPTPLDPFLARLRSAGFDSAHVRRALLPAWWDDDVAATEAGLYAALNHVASRLGVSVAALRGGEPLVLAANCAVRHKLAKGTSPKDVQLAELLALRVAQAVVGAAGPSCQPVPDAGTVRQRILGTGAPWVDFEHLLDWCWDNGVVVLHVSDFPKKTKKPHGFASLLHGRPFIVLCWNERRPSWVLFHLAHELGHLALGHVTEGALLVDEKIDAESHETEEAQANAYALTVITGKGDRDLASSGRWPITAEMVKAAREYGASHQIDPGHVALNYARTMTGRTGARFFALAGAALRELEPGADAVEMVRDRLARRLDWDALHDDARDFVEQMTGMSQ